MLRDALCRLERFSTWPCDEINCIWRHGNKRWPTDSLPPHLARPEVVAYIRASFRRRHRLDRCDVVVEKTCANCLRIPFVRAVLPEAKFLVLLRTAADAVASASLRWRAPVDLRYTLAKSRFVPTTDMPYYALRFLRNRLWRLASKEDRLGWWGPRPDSFRELRALPDLIEVCARQWLDCVTRSSESLLEMAPGTVAVVRYEDFVVDPSERLAATLRGLYGLQPLPQQLAYATRDVGTDRIGRGHARLSDRDLDVVREITRRAAISVERLVATHAL